MNDLCELVCIALIELTHSFGDDVRAEAAIDAGAIRFAAASGVRNGIDKTEWLNSVGEAWDAVAALRDKNA